MHPKHRHHCILVSVILTEEQQVNKCLMISTSTPPLSCVVRLLITVQVCLCFVIKLSRMARCVTKSKACWFFLVVCVDSKRLCLINKQSTHIILYHSVRAYNSRLYSVVCPHHIGPISC